jgi:hypothetical protein
MSFHGYLAWMYFFPTEEALGQMGEASPGLVGIQGVAFGKPLDADGRLFHRAVIP